MTVPAIPEEDKKKLDEGVEAFWKTFTATGVGAKVIKISEPEEAIPIQNREDLCSGLQILTQKYSRGQNDADQLKTQAEKKQTRKCMYQTAQVDVKWKVESECDCTGRRKKQCEGKMKVELTVEIIGLKTGTPGEHVLVQAKAPRKPYRTKKTARARDNADQANGPGPNLNIKIRSPQPLEENRIAFVQKNDTFVYKTTTEVPCKVDTHSVRFLIKKPMSDRDQHSYQGEASFILDANIILNHMDCAFSKIQIDAFAAEFRANWFPPDVKYLQAGKLISISPKDELPQVVVNNDGKIYYSLLKLIEQNGKYEGDPYPAKDEDVRETE